MKLYMPEELDAHEQVGMATAYWARLKPSSVAVHDRFGSKTFAEVNATANRIVRMLRAHGIVAGDHVAFAMSNRAEVVEILAAILRGGYRVVPVNWHFTEREVAYILEDSDAKAFFTETRFSAALAASRDAVGLQLRVVVGGPADGHVVLDEALDGLDGDDIADPQLGRTMFYTSGTTGRPKGVFAPQLRLLGVASLARYDPDHSVQLCVGPLYHGAPLTLETRTAMTLGVPLVYMEKWDSIEVLRTIERFRITHTHLVPVMMRRLLSLPSETRARFDVSSLKFINHGAAPCPIETKRAMIDWVGPILLEYYAGTEGGAGFEINSEEWLRKPGSVGKRPVGIGVHVLDDAGAECPPNVPGRLFFERSKASPFVYYKDDEKTRAAHLGDYFTLGDIGYFDDDDYLFLTGRSAECIISGGVNIYPQEIDNALLEHPAVEDSCTVGVPSDEWGEEVRAVIQLRAGVAAGATLTEDIKAFARQRLAGYKVPRSIDFVDEVPRNDAGKIERAKVRARYWEGRAIQI